MWALRVVFSFAFFLAMTLLGLRLALHENGNTATQLFEHLRAVHLTVAVTAWLIALSVAVYVADAFRYVVFARSFGISIRFRTAIRTTIGCLLFSWISPGAVLGPPAAVYLLVEGGIRWDEALLLSYGKSLSGSLLLLVLSLFLIGMGFLPGGVRSSPSIFLLLCLAIYILLLFTPPLRSRLKMLVRAGPRALTLILSSIILYFSALIGVLVTLAWALGAESLGRISAVSTLYTTLLYMSPTPSGSGVAEATASSFFGALLSHSDAILLVVMFRGITYYAQILFGAVYFACTGGRRPFREIMRLKPLEKSEPGPT